MPCRSSRLRRGSEDWAQELWYWFSPANIFVRFCFGVLVRCLADCARDSHSRMTQESHSDHLDDPILQLADQIFLQAILLLL